MVTHRTIQISSLSPNFSHLMCDICGSTNIISTTERYVCRECGIVIEIQKLQHDSPYNEDLIQYAKSLGTMQIGTKRERAISSNSEKLHRLNRHNSITDNKNIVSSRVRIVISRVFTCLGMADYDWLKEMIFHKFKEIRPKLRHRTKYRNPEKLVPILTYFCLKLQNISINQRDLIEISNISKKEFNNFRLQIQRFIPRYIERNRQEYILQRVLEVTEHFKLDMQFYFQAEKILFKLWEGIKNTTDNVVVGLITSITTLCSYKDKVRVSAICDRLGIRMSTIQFQVKERLFKRFNVEGFVSLVKSTELLQKIIRTLGLLEHQEKKQDNVEWDKVEIIFGKVDDEFQTLKYFFSIPDETNFQNILFLDINHPLIESDTNSGFKKKKIIEFEYFTYYKSKDPPTRLLF